MQLAKDKLLMTFKRGRAQGKLSVSVRCPLCGGIFATAYFEVHVRNGH